MRQFILSAAVLAFAGTAGMGLYTATSTPAFATAAAVEEAKTWRTATASFARTNFRTPDMGYAHLDRTYQLAVELAREDGVVLDDDVLYAAAMLHDIAEFKPWAKPGLDHSDVGADIAPKYLGKFGFPMEKVAAVQDAIRTHMYYRDPVSDEARYLHDADALEGLGAVGVMRYTAMIDAEGKVANSVAVMKVVATNLKEIPGRLATPAGNRRMPERRDEMRAFMTSLAAQTASYKTL